MTAYSASNRVIFPGQRPPGAASRVFQQHRSFMQRWKIGATLDNGRVPFVLQRMIISQQQRGPRICQHGEKKEIYMAHGLEETIREAYAAFGRGDVDGYLQPCTQDFSFNIPGRGAIAGSWRGRGGLYELARMAMEATGGSFREEVEDVLANDHHAVVLARHRFTRDGQPREYRTAHVYEIHNGRLAQCWEQPQDLTEFDEAWGIGQARSAKP